MIAFATKPREYKKSGSFAQYAESLPLPRIYAVRQLNIRRYNRAQEGVIDNELDVRMLMGTQERRNIEPNASLLRILEVRWIGRQRQRAKK